jgi:O-antigen ligase
MSKSSFIIRGIADIILRLQPLFPIPIYFTVLTNHPPLWLSIIIGLFPFLLRYHYQKVFIKQTPFDIPILIFITGSIVGFFIAINKNTAGGALISLLASILIYYSIVSNRDEGKKYWISFGIVIFLICMGLSIWFFSQGTGRFFSFNQWIFDIFKAFPKTTSPVLHQHGIGALFSVVIPVIFGGILFSKNTSHRILLSILCALLMVILFLSVSGGGWIALGIGISFVLICWRLQVVFYLIPISGILTALSLFFYTNTYWLSSSFSTSTLIGRFNLWVKTIPMLNDWHAFFGIGLGNWAEEFYNLYQNQEIHMHNNYFQIYTDMGIFAIIAVSLATLIFIRTSFKILKSHRQDTLWGIGVGIIGSFMAGAFFNTLDVTLTGMIIDRGHYTYLSIPLLWIWAAFYVVVYHKLFPHEKSVLNKLY